MFSSNFEEHLRDPSGFQRAINNASVGLAGGATCGDVVRFSLRVDGGRVAAAGFDAEGCGAMIAAGSAAVTLCEGQPLLAAALVGSHAISTELGGLMPGKLHAAELVADAYHRALGNAVRAADALPAQPKRTLVAMSGGVDSSVACILEARADREVVAVTLELWRDLENDGERSCCSAQAVRAAREVAHQLGLPHFTLDLREQFRAGVVDPYLQDYAAGLTPNPCVRCNGHVRLDAMIEFADRLGAAKLATGHYARVVADEDGSLLQIPVDQHKDQTYMLAALAEPSIARMSFPLGDLTKPEVRQLAAEAQLPVADKPDSQDLCFLAGTNRTDFLARHAGIPDRAGEIVDANGAVLGNHRGAQHYTVGQRRGIGVAAAEPLYVLRTEASTNRVVVGAKAELATDRVEVRSVDLRRPGERVNRVKLRYRSRPFPCMLLDRPTAGMHKRLTVHLHEPVHGAAPGQAACFLADDRIVGWGWIARATNS